MPTCGYVSTVYVRGCVPVRASLVQMQTHSVLISTTCSANSRYFPCPSANLGGKIGGHVVPRFYNSDLVLLQRHVFFWTWGKSSSQANITRSGELLIKLKGEVRNSLGGRQWRQRGVFVVSGAAGIGKSSWAVPRTHTHHYLTKNWQEDYPSWLKACVIYVSADDMFLSLCCQHA